MAERLSSCKTQRSQCIPLIRRDYRYSSRSSSLPNLAMSKLADHLRNKGVEKEQPTSTEQEKSIIAPLFLHIFQYHHRVYKRKHAQECHCPSNLNGDSTQSICAYSQVLSNQHDDTGYLYTRREENCTFKELFASFTENISESRRTRARNRAMESEAESKEKP